MEEKGDMVKKLWLKITGFVINCLLDWTKYSINIKFTHFLHIKCFPGRYILKLQSLLLTTVLKLEFYSYGKPMVQTCKKIYNWEHNNYFKMK